MANRYEKIFNLEHKGNPNIGQNKTSVYSYQLTKMRNY